MDEIFPIEITSIDRARTLVLGYSTLSAGDAIHVATMQENGVSQIVSLDRGFDAIPG